jgi:hypothetical protein
VINVPPCFIGFGIAVAYYSCVLVSPYKVTLFVPYFARPERHPAPPIFLVFLSSAGFCILTLMP